MHEKTIPYRSLRYRMVVPQSTLTYTRICWPTSGSLLTRNSRCHLLHRQKRLCLATSAPQLPALEDRLPLLQSLATGWNMGEDAHRFARADACAHWEEPSAQRRDRRQPIG